MTNNADWLDPLSLEDVIKLASTVTLNQLLAKEAFGNRLDQQQPMYLSTSFSTHSCKPTTPSLSARTSSLAERTSASISYRGENSSRATGKKHRWPCSFLCLKARTASRKCRRHTTITSLSKIFPTICSEKCMRIPDELIIKYFELASSFTGKRN